MEASTSAGVDRLTEGMIGFLLLPRFALIALSSAIEPLRVANRYLSTPYRWVVLTTDGLAVEDNNGISIRPHASIDKAPPLRTLIVCADVQPERHYSRHLRSWLWTLNSRQVALGALDTGCFILARAGLLNDCRVTVHWEVAEAFKDRYPKLNLVDSLFEVDRQRLTCAGGTAAIDMMLQFIEQEHGSELSDRVAEHCLHAGKRQGDKRQRMELTASGRVHHTGLAASIVFLQANLGRAVSVTELAEHVGLSPRQLIRLFSSTLGTGPSHYHRRLRLEHARSMLLYTQIPIAEAAVVVGFESLASFSRAYRRQFGQSPSFHRDARASRRV